MRLKLRPLRPELSIFHKLIKWVSQQVLAGVARRHSGHALHRAFKRAPTSISRNADDVVERALSAAHGMQGPGNSVAKPPCPEVLADMLVEYLGKVVRLET